MFTFEIGLFCTSTTLPDTLMLFVHINEKKSIIIDNEFVKPGKGQAFNRIKIRNLKTSRVLEKTYKSGDSLEAADVVEIEMQYLYNDGENWYFMDQNTFEQYAANENAITDAKQWITGEEICFVTLWNEVPLTIAPPNFVILKIKDTDPGVRGDTAQGGSKPATLETGTIVKVPLFIDAGDSLKIDTRTGEYVSRAKE